MAQQRVAIGLALLLGLLASGCGLTPVQQFRMGIEGVAHFNTAALDSLEAAQPQVNRRAEDAVAEEYTRAISAHRECVAAGYLDCTDPGTAEEWLARWDERVRGINLGLDAIDEINAWLVRAAREADRWRDARTDEAPDVVRRLCGTLGNTMEGVLGALRLVGVDYPSYVSDVATYLGPACGFAVSIFDRERREP